MKLTRRSVLTALASSGVVLAADGLSGAARAACSSIGALPDVGPAFAGGLETRNGVNVGYYPFRVCGGTWLLSGEAGSVGSRRLAWLEHGTEFSLQSNLNFAACSADTTCGSDSPALRPLADNHAWGYPERHPSAYVDAPKAPTSDQGWVLMRDLEFVGYRRHTRRLGPGCADFEVVTNTSDGRRIVANSVAGRGSAACRRNPSCDEVNSCTEGDDDCVSDFGETMDFSDAPRPATILGGYEFRPFVDSGVSPDLVIREPMPLSLLNYAPRSSKKCYLHEGDEVDVLFRRTMYISHPRTAPTEAVWYGVEVTRSACPRLTPVGVRGWVMAWSQWDSMQSGRGQYVTSVL